MLKSLKKNGFASMVEVVVTSVIFIIAAFGIFSTISALQPQGRQSSTKLDAIYAGKSVVDNLRAHVDARVWNDSGNPLALGNHTETINAYNITYTVTDEPSLNARKLQMTINYSDN